ncbi:S8 family peptidase [Lewinella cohaerens]|uniref:S8 family peptidase n=1 Tax=Lewinella cohaerens TaxID=70995 RepID=UPI00037C5E22|nr:S8 family serine peptidase [Lewinella cohaerens]
MYTLGFVLTLLGLMGVMLDRKGLEALSYAVVPGLGLWLFGLVTQVSTLGDFFSYSFTDLLFYGGAAMLFRGLSQSKHLAIPASIVALLMMAFFHQNIRPQAEDMPATTQYGLAAEGELLVELSDEDNLERWKRWIGAQGWTTERAFAPEEGARTDLDDYFTVNIPANELSNLEEIITRIESTGWTDWVEPNETIQIELSPARILPKLNKILGVNDPAVEQQWALQVLEMNKLYDLLNSDKVKTRKKAIVAILDTGVDAGHEDLKDNFYSIAKKYNDDPQGHGTHCAGIAGAVTDNGVGVASFARTGDYFQITSVKVLKAGGSGSQQDIINGIITAVDKGADVLSMSLGGFSTQSRQRAYSEAVRYATDRNVIVVASAGNSNRDAAGFSPVNANGVIGVSAIDNQLQRASFSNKVNRIGMAVAAPGVGIYSTKPNNNYAAHNGTSMAAPFVSGLLGIMKSIRPELTNKEAFKILQQTGKNTRDTANTGRLIQPAAAVEAVLDNNL